MDYLARLIGVMLFVLPFSAVSAEYWFATGKPNQPSLAAATQWTCSYPANTKDQTCVVEKMNDQYYLIKAHFVDQYNQTGGWQIQWGVVCDSGQTFNHALKKCSAPAPVCTGSQVLDPESNACVCKSIRNYGSLMVSGDQFKGCNQGCAVTLTKGWYDKTANVTWGMWDQQPSSCGVGDPNVFPPTDPKVEAQKRCDAGTCPGTVNGTFKCLPCDSAKQSQTTQTSSSSSTSASGSTTSTTTTEASKTTANTTCSGGSCTTTSTTTSTGANGDKVDTTSTKVEPQSDYCTKNPKAAVCKGTESSWGGSCGAFSCDGDAVSCAISQAVWKSACLTDVSVTDPLVQQGQTAMSNGNRASDHPANSAQSLGFSANLNQTNPYGNSCPADIQLDIMGNAVAIPLSTACDSFVLMGRFLVAVTLVAAAGIVFGGVKS